ncbi:SCN11A, partial [Symbiodinium pilosum]
MALVLQVSWKPLTPHPLCFFGREFFCSYDRVNLFWNYLDTVLVGISIVETVLVMVLVEDTEIGMSNKLRTMRIVRLTRLIRLMRAVRFFQGLRTLIYSIFYTLKALAWSLVLLLLMIYVLGILLTDATLAHVISYENATVIPDDSTDELLFNHFGSLHLSMHTLFRSITGGLDWSNVAEALAPLNWIWVYLFSAYIAFCLFAVLNVMTGVFCQRATELAERDHEAQLLGLQMENERVRDESRTLFRSFDVAKQGSLTLLEFELMFQRDDIKASLQVLDIEVSEADAWRFFRLLDTDGDGDVTEDDFIEGVLHLRGPARTIDVACEAEENRRMKAKLAQIEAQDRRMEILLRSMVGQLTQLGQRMEDLRLQAGCGRQADEKDTPQGRGNEAEQAGKKDPGSPAASPAASPSSSSAVNARAGRPQNQGAAGVVANEVDKEPKPPGPVPTSPLPPQSPSLRLLASPSSPKGTPVFLLDPSEATLQAASDRVHQQIERERLLKWDFDLHYDMDPRMAALNSSPKTR